MPECGNVPPLFYHVVLYVRTPDARATGIRDKDTIKALLILVRRRKHSPQAQARVVLISPCLVDTEIHSM